MKLFLLMNLIIKISWKYKKPQYIVYFHRTGTCFLPEAVFLREKDSKRFQFNFDLEALNSTQNGLACPQPVVSTTLPSSCLSLITTFPIHLLQTNTIAGLFYPAQCC